MTILATNTALLIILIIAAVILVGVIVFILYKFVFFKRAINKQIKDLERKFNYLDALLIGQDSQYVKRIEIISRTNLLYCDVYSNYNKRFKEVLDVDAKYAEGTIKQLHALVDNKQFKTIKSVIDESKKAIATFEENLLQLDKELAELIKPEEDARQSILKLKESFRIIKQNYYNHQKELETVSESLEKVFRKLEELFKKFEECVECANYDEANEMLPTISNALQVLTNVLDKIPMLSTLVNKIIPEKIVELKKEEKTLSDNEYPLYHLLTTQTFDEFKNSLFEMSKRLEALNIDGVQEKCDSIQKKIEELHVSFQEEVNAKSKFDDTCDVVYHNVMDLERAFLKLCSLLPEMNKYYKISESDNQNIESLKGTINLLTNSKRRLDTYIHSATKQPYSVLVQKLNDLTNDYESALEGVNQLKIFFEGLKKTAEDAYDLVFSYYYQIKEIEFKIKSIALPSYTDEKYNERIDRLFDILNSISDILKIAPIDIEKLNNYVNEVKSEFEILKTDADNDFNYSRMAESSTIYANKYRHHQKDFNEQLLMYESDFFKGEFKKAFTEVTEFLVKAKSINESSNK